MRRKGGGGGGNIDIKEKRDLRKRKISTITIKKIRLGGENMKMLRETEGLNVRCVEAVVE